MNFLRNCLSIVIAGVSIYSYTVPTQGITTEAVVKPVVVTDTVVFDTDDPAIWVHPTDKSKTLIIGNDKGDNGRIYAFDLNGKIVAKSVPLRHTNNIDVAYGFVHNDKAVDIVAATERFTNKVRILSLPDLQLIDDGGLSAFDGEDERAPMGIALYTRPSDKACFAIVCTKYGPKDGYLWQYRLSSKHGKLDWEPVRKFGKFSGKKEIEAIAVDNELGYIYYGDEMHGIRKYFADPLLNNNTEMALFGVKDFKEDIEGISIYKTSPSTGYILVSNQQDNSFNVYRREGDTQNRHYHRLLAKVPASTIESDGSDVTNVNLGNKYPKGLFVAMSNGKVFHYYDWRDIEKKARLKTD